MASTWALPKARKSESVSATGVKLLVIVEGQHDVTLFRGISRIARPASVQLIA